MSQPEIAYLRDYDFKNCNICFFLNFETTEGVSLTKEIKSTAKAADTLAVLKNNIRKTIFHLNENNNENEGDEQVLVKLPNCLEEVYVEFLKQDKPFSSDIVLKNFYKLQEEKFIKVLDQKFLIILNAPLVSLLKIPNVICATFPVKPVGFKVYNLHKEATQFIWYKSRDKEIWQKVGEGYEYNVNENDVGYFLKLFCVPYNKFKLKGPTVETISENKVTLIPEFPKCPFETRHVLTTKTLLGNELRVVSYNILADRYVDGAQFYYCPLTAQCIHYRKQLILKELEGYNADIICLQEVDETHYKTYYKKELMSRGFSIFFNKKGNCISEGLACAFKRNRFNLVDYKHIVLKSAVERRQFKDVLDILNLNEEVKNEFLKQNTSLQSVVLEDKNTKKILVVGNTHLFYRPDANHIRLLQAFMATLHLSHIKYRMMRKLQTNNVAILFCGDFNSDVVKSLYGFMIRGTISHKHEDCLKISPSGNATIYHKLDLVSASGTPKYTNYTDEYKGCLDYIFVEKHKFSVAQVVPVPTEQELQSYVGLPNEFYPSDHLALVVDLKFTSRR